MNKKAGIVSFLIGTFFTGGGMSALGNGRSQAIYGVIFGMIFIVSGILSFKKPYGAFVLNVLTGVGAVFYIINEFVDGNPHNIGIGSLIFWFIILYGIAIRNHGASKEC